jgi:16S rRNA (guanine527-N7)-methyltransferase
VHDIIFRYFPNLDAISQERFIRLEEIYRRWNSRINVISRKDIDNFYIHHVLHSLAIARIINFVPGTTLLDVGTGGGFPGIPLAVLFPSSFFTLLDSVGKKIRVVSSVASELGLENIIPVLKRAESETGKFDFIISRAVSELPRFIKLVQKNIRTSSLNSLQNGILYLKGGDLSDELNGIKQQFNVWDISSFFREPYFETKKIVYVRL